MAGDRWILLMACIVLAAAAVSGCAKERPLTEQDLTDGRATVEKALNSSSFEEFLQCMSRRNREAMHHDEVFRRFWSDLKRDGEPVWRVGDITDGGSGRIKVETTWIPDSPEWGADSPDSAEEGLRLTLSERRQESLRVYFLIREDGSWVMDEIAFGL